MESLILKIPKEDSLTDDELFRICNANKELRIERDESGQLIIMSPAGSFSSNRNFILNGLFSQWVESHLDLGYAFDSSGGFILPDNSMRSPDTAWIKKDRWDSLTVEAREKFAPICPDFIVELRSKSDSLGQLKKKMEAWIANGCQLAWLIDPIEKKAYIYKPNFSLTVEAREKFAPICPDFIVELRSKSDSLSELKKKMEAWITNGCELAWLIDPIERKAYIYKPNAPMRELNDFSGKLSGENLLPGFELDLKRFA